MIHYIFIILAVVCFAGQFAFTKIYGKTVEETAVTTIVMLIVTSAFGALLYLLVGGFRLQFTAWATVLAICLAVIMIPYYMLGIKVLSLGSLAVYSMFMMLGGMLVPFFYGAFFLNESISVAQMIGTVLLSLFIILQAVWQDNGGGAKKDGQAKGGRYLFFALCIAVFFINGFTGVIAKAHQISENAVDEISFTVISCGFTALFSAFMLPIYSIKNRSEAKRQAFSTLKKKPFIAMLLVGAAAYTGSFLHLKAAAAIPASVQFPLVSGGVIVLSAFVSQFIFREKLSKKEWISVAGAFASTVLYAF